MKLDKRDLLYSKIIRGSSGEPPVCEYCRKEFPELRGLECAHIYGRRHKTARWSLNPRNAVSLCHYHHRYFTERPVDFTRWLEGYLGDDELERLRELVHCGDKLTTADKEDLYQYLRDCYQELAQRRLEGDTGIISFKEWSRKG